MSATNWWWRSRREFVRDLAYAHAPDPVDSLLDVGCLDGSLLQVFGGVPRRFGMDISPIAIELVPDALRGRISFARASGLRAPFAPASFDVVTSVDVIEHIDNDVAALGEMARVLRPGGTLIVVVPAHEWLRTSRDDRLGHLRRYERSGLESTIRGTGLEVVWSTYFAGSVLLPLLGVRALEWVASRRIRGARRAAQYRSGWLNELLDRLHAFEARLGGRVRIPIGSAIACVGRKPAVHVAG